MNRYITHLYLIAITLISVSCSGKHGDFAVAFPNGYQYVRITNDYHVITSRNPVSGSNEIFVSANISIIGYHHPFIAGRVTEPTPLVETSEVVLGYFIVDVEDGSKQTGLSECEFWNKLRSLDLTRVDLMTPIDFASERNPFVASGLLRIE